MPLFDAHCHLQDARLMPDIRGVLERAAARDVQGFCCCGTAESDWAAVRGLASSHPTIVPAFGIHPWRLAQRTSGWLDTLESCLRQPGSAAGEIGLDHAMEEADRIEQEAVFVAQLDRAIEMGRPVVAHCRRAWGRLMDILRRRGGHRPGILLHSFSGAADLVPDLIRLGCFFSFSGSVTRSGNRRGHKALAAVPEDRLMIETDSPDLLPVIPGRDAVETNESRAANEPANLVYVLRCAAEVRGVQPERIAEITWNNACRFFGRNEAGAGRD